MPELSEAEFYESRLLRGAVEYMRGQYAATMGPKRDFVSRILNELEDRKFIGGWEPAGGQNRYDYEVHLKSGRIAAIELKGCLDGNNTTIFERPARANEFIIWSVCDNPDSDPEKSVWSGIHTRLSAEIVHRKVCVDGLVVWDMLCDSKARQCPKVLMSNATKNIIGQYSLPPPCLYLFPGTIPTPRNNPAPLPHELRDVEILSVLREAFGGDDDTISYVKIEARQNANETERLTRIYRGGVEQRASRWTPIRRA